MNWFGWLDWFEPKSKYPPVDDMMFEIGTTLYLAVMKLSREAPRQIMDEIRKSGIPASDVPYLLWVLGNDETSWPPLGQWEKDGLRLALFAMGRIGVSLSHVSGFAVPDGADTDERTDAAILRLGGWARRKFLAGALEAYLGVLRAQAPKLRRLYPVELPTNSHAVSALRLTFPEILDSKGHWFQDDILLRRVVHSFGL